VPLIDIALAVIAGVLAITLHEAAHGYAALAMGDDTARKAGRLSLNPLRHVDRVGTILLPLALAVGQLLTIGRIAFMFGWAKPVPVAAWKFRNPRRGMMVVAAAGPAMNFFLSFLGSLALVTVFPDAGVDDARATVGFLISFIVINIALGLFNLLPFPPLDGGRVVVGLLPEGAARAWARLERFGILIVVLIVFIIPEASRDFGHPVNPVGWLIDRALPWLLDADLRMADSVASWFTGWTGAPTSNV
jgi:Zn-dependent protease